MASIGSITIKLEDEDRAQLARLERLLKGQCLVLAASSSQPIRVKNASFRLELEDGSVLETTLESADVSRLNQWSGVRQSEIEGMPGHVTVEPDGTRGFDLRVVGFLPRKP